MWHKDVSNTRKSELVLWLFTKPPKRIRFGGFALKLKNGKKKSTVGFCNFNRS